MRVHVLNGRWPVAKIDIDTNRVNFGITSDSTKKLFANRRVLIEALAVKNEPGEERLVDEFASVNMQKCLGIQQVPFAAVYYNGERIDSSGQLNVVKSGGALQIRLFDEFSKWDVSKVQIIMARGKRPLGQFSNRISEQGLSRLAPGDRVFLFYTSVDIDVWEQGFQYVVELPVLSSEYKPSYVVQPMGLQCVL